MNVSVLVFADIDGTQRQLSLVVAVHYSRYIQLAGWHRCKLVRKTTEFCLFFGLSVAPAILLSDHSQTMVGVATTDTNESRGLPTSKTIQISC